MNGETENLGASGSTTPATKLAAAPPVPGRSFTRYRLYVTAGPAQGSEGANYQQREFNDHAVVKIASIFPSAIFDPSYGNKFTGANMDAAELSWEDGSIDSFLLIYRNNTTGEEDASRSELDTKGLLQTLFSS